MRSNELHYVEIEYFGKLKGFAFCDPGTTFIRYQIAAPHDDCASWHVVEVVRGGDEPFEFIHLGWAKSRANAFRIVRRAWTEHLLAFEEGTPNAD